MQIEENENLAQYTTFKIGGDARFFCAVKNIEELKEAVGFVKDKGLNVLILAGGSNMVVSDEGFEGLVIKVEFLGRKIVKEDKESVWLEIAAGEEWDEIVAMAVSRNWWGIENLSHIPGKAGTIAVQNVGAYGQEASQVVETVKVYDIKNSEVRTIPNIECKFGYRSSIFNREEKGRYVILSVVLKLDKIPAPELSYRDLKAMFEGKIPALADIREMVTIIRDKKFPYPTEAKNGNSGSFFKNVVLDNEMFSGLEDIFRKNFGEEVLEQLRAKVFRGNDTVKIPAAFLLDVCGLKGVKLSKVATNANQPLVIINSSGKAKAKDVLELAAKVLTIVKEKTGLVLEIEPELVGFSPEELSLFGKKV